MKQSLFFAFALVLFACSEGNVENSVDQIAEISEVDEIEIIHSKIKTFSEHNVAGDCESVGNMHTKDAKIFPSNLDIIEGREGVTGYWNAPSS